VVPAQGHAQVGI